MQFSLSIPSSDFLYESWIEPHREIESLRCVSLSFVQFSEPFTTSRAEMCEGRGKGPSAAAA